MTSLEQLIPLAAESLLGMCDRPFAFFGHSMGALIAFELARIMETQLDRTPMHLFVAGRKPPHLLDPEPRTYHLPDPEFIAELRRLNGTPEELFNNPEAMEMILPIVRADFELVQTYSCRHSPPLRCPIRAFGGLRDRGTKPEHLERWKDLTLASFSMTMISGDHFFVNTSRNELLFVLNRDLQKILQRSNSKAH